MNTEDWLARALILARTPSPAEARRRRRLEREKTEVAARIEDVRKKLRAAREQYRTESARQRDKAVPSVSSIEHKRKRRNAWFKERAASDPSFKLNRNTRHAINQSLNGTKRRRTWQSLVGYSLTELKAHLEAQFTDGMTWENIGEWHVDHIRPLSSFNITSAECDDFKQAWALSNLQPLWGPDNLKKGARWEP